MNTKIITKAQQSALLRCLAKGYSKLSKKDKSLVRQVAFADPPYQPR